MKKNYLKYVSGMRLSRQSQLGEGLHPKRHFSFLSPLSSLLLKSLFPLSSLLLLSCEYDPLCYNHNHGADLRIDVDWSEFQEETPTGMTVQVYPLVSEKQDTTLTLLSNDITHVDFKRLPGTFQAMAFNQSESEFGTLYFTSLHDYDAATVYAQTVEETRWYRASSKADPDEKVVQDVEWIASGVSKVFNVEEAWVDDSIRRTIATITPHNMVYTVTVRVQLANVYNLRSARAALTGMAAGCSLATQTPTTETATPLVENFHLVTDSLNPVNGYIEGTVHCFGLPKGHHAIYTDNTLKLSLLLVDNKTTVTCDFPVGDIFQRPGDHQLLLDLTLPKVLPDVKPEGGSESGFDVIVDDWGPTEEYEIPVE